MIQHVRNMLALTGTAWLFHHPAARDVDVHADLPCPSVSSASAAAAQTAPCAAPVQQAALAKIG